jgi:hypothetical protein
MPMEALEQLGPDDVLAPDRVCPAACLVARLMPFGIRFAMRCDNDSGRAAGSSFMRSDKDEVWVTLHAPSAERRGRVRDCGCPAQAPRLRLVRQVAPHGAVRVLATNLDSTLHPGVAFGVLCHRGWRIEEALEASAALRGPQRRCLSRRLAAIRHAEAIGMAAPTHCGRHLRVNAPCSTPPARRCRRSRRSWHWT